PQRLPRGEGPQARAHRCPSSFALLASPINADGSARLFPCRRRIERPLEDALEALLGARLILGWPVPLLGRLRKRHRPSFLQQRRPMTDKPTPTPRQFDRVARFLMHYGDFLAFFSTFDMMVEILIMRKLGISKE